MRETRLNWLKLTALVVSAWASVLGLPAGAVAKTAVSSPKTPSFLRLTAAARLPLPSAATFMAAQFGTFAAGSSVVAATVAYDAGSTPCTAVAVYAKPPTGWSAQIVPAELPDPGPGCTLGLLAADDQLVAVERDSVSTVGDQPVGDQQVSVYVPGSAGWSGIITSSATLDSGASSASYGNGVVPIAASGPSVFVAAGNVVDAFRQPSTGWAGTLQPSATLNLPRGRRVDAVAADGRTVVAERDATLFIYQEPASGWQGAVAPVATLHIPGKADFNPRSVAISRRTIAVENPSGVGPAVYVFTKPAAGWRRATAPKRLLTDHDYLPGAVVNTALAGGVIGVDETSPGDTHTCPCASKLFALRGSPSGWPASTLLATSRGLTTSGTTTGLVGVGSDFAAGTANSIYLYEPRPAR